MARARAIVGEVPVIAVNGAARDVKAFAIYSQHAERFTQRGFDWIRHQKRLFGPDFTVHSARWRDGCPWVQYWWPEATGPGSSAWDARKVAWLMGFETVILCGCPLVPGPYVDYRLGGLMHRADVVDSYLLAIAADVDWHPGVYSMSGRTGELFGEPKWTEMSCDGSKPM